MTRIAYVDKKFRQGALDIIAHADAIMEEYRLKGYTLTLRQLYYQFVARAIIPNKQNEYKRLGEIVNDARMAGMLDWDNIEDRTRGVEEPPAWDSPSQIMRASAQQYQIDLWEGQLLRPEVWIEKEALAGVVEPVCEENRVAYLSCRGYTSASESWRAAMRLVRRYRETKQRTLILHLGDHDPSGLDMTRDNRERLEVFCRHHLGTVPFKLVRIALNMDQVDQWNPPPNPAKATDSRFEDYQRQFGDESWELDALDPATISRLIEEQVTEIRDPDAWAVRVEQENSEKGQMGLLADNFDDAVDYLEAR